MLLDAFTEGKCAVHPPFEIVRPAPVSPDDIITARSDIGVYNNLTPPLLLSKLAWVPLRVSYCPKITNLAGFWVDYLWIRHSVHYVMSGLVFTKSIASLDYLSQHPSSPWIKAADKINRWADTLQQVVSTHRAKANSNYETLKISKYSKFLNNS